MAAAGSDLPAAEQFLSQLIDVFRADDDSAIIVELRKLHQELHAVFKRKEGDAKAIISGERGRVVSPLSRATCR